MSWGEAVGRATQPPIVFALSGPLGAGKTVLAQAIRRGYGVTEAVTSPTYALVDEYVGATLNRVPRGSYRPYRGPRSTLSCWPGMRW